MREGIRRLAVCLRWLGWLWLGGMVVYWTVAREQLGDASWAERLIVGALILAPGYISLAVAWVLDGFAQKSIKDGRS